MKINRFLFPIIVLAIFFLVIGGSMFLGFWRTKGGHGGGSGHEDSSLPAIEMIVQASPTLQFGEVTS